MHVSDESASSSVATSVTITERPDTEGTADEAASELEKNRKLREARTCKVCMDRETNTVFLPCGHLVCCEACAKSLSDCPICRSVIRGTVKTFLSWIFSNCTVSRTTPPFQITRSKPRTTHSKEYRRTLLGHDAVTADSGKKSVHCSACHASCVGAEEHHK